MLDYYSETTHNEDNWLLLFTNPNVINFNDCFGESQLGFVMYNFQKLGV